MMANMVKRPFAVSAPNLGCFSAASLGVGIFQSWSPAASAVPAGWSWDSSQDAPQATTCAQPAAGALENAPSPFGLSVDFRPAEGDRCPGSLPANPGAK